MSARATRSAVELASSATLSSTVCDEQGRHAGHDHRKLDGDDAAPLAPAFVD